MALFGGKRDAKFIAAINSELINSVIDTEIEFYKLVIEQSNSNIYGESDAKKYYNPVRIPGLILKEEKSMVNEDFGLDSTRIGTFAFSRDYLKDRNIMIEEGDILYYDNEYYEADSVHGSQYWTGRNPSTDIGFTVGDRGEFGYNVAIRVEAHITRRNKLNLVDVRFGGDNQEYQLPKNL